MLFVFSLWLEFHGSQFAFMQDNNRQTFQLGSRVNTKTLQLFRKRKQLRHLLFEGCHHFSFKNKSVIVISFISLLYRVDAIFTLASISRKAASITRYNCKMEDGKYARFKVQQKQQDWFYAQCAPLTVSIAMSLYHVSRRAGFVFQGFGG